MQRRYLSAIFDFDECNAVHAATREPQISIGSGHHVPHHASAGRNNPRLKLLRLGIKTHDRIRLGVRFAVPDDVSDNGDGVGPGARPAGRSPFRDSARLSLVIYARRLPGAIGNEASPFKSKTNPPSPERPVGGGFADCRRSVLLAGISQEFIKPMGVLFVYVAGRVCP